MFPLLFLLLASRNNQSVRRGKYDLVTRRDVLIVVVVIFTAVLIGLGIGAWIIS